MAELAFGGTNTEAKKEQNYKNSPLGPYVEMQRSAFASISDKRAEKQYKERETEISPWLEDVVLANSGNAALLYYQAFLLRPEPSEAISDKINTIFGGEEADREVRTYLGHCLPMINLTEIASRIPQCAWGMWHGPGSGFYVGDLRSNVISLTKILGVDARTLATDGHYRAALEHCLTLRRLARHLSSDSKLYLISREPDFIALRMVQHVLGVMPLDVDTLMWFRGQLATVQGEQPVYTIMLQTHLKSILNNMRTHPTLLAKLRNQLVEKAEDEQSKDIARNLTDEQLLAHARGPYTAYLDLIFKVIDSEMTYEQKYALMKSLTNKLRDEYDDDPVVAQVLYRCATDSVILGQYSKQVGHIAHINGIKTAVEIYLVLAKTGKLPEKLPDYLPKDPFTGQDFVYEITDDGFALRCQGEEFLRRMNHFLEFKVKK